MQATPRKDIKRHDFLLRYNVSIPLKANISSTPSTRAVLRSCVSGQYTTEKTTKINPTVLSTIDRRPNNATTPSERHSHIMSANLPTIQGPKPPRKIPLCYMHSSAHFCNPRPLNTPISLPLLSTHFPQPLLSTTPTNSTVQRIINNPPQHTTPNQCTQQKDNASSK